MRRIHEHAVDVEDRTEECFVHRFSPFVEWAAVAEGAPRTLKVQLSPAESSRSSSPTLNVTGWTEPLTVGGDRQLAGLERHL